MKVRGLYRYYKDKNRRKLYLKNELNFLFLKSMTSTKFCSLSYRTNITKNHYRLRQSYGLRSKIRNRCLHKDSARSVISKFKLSATCFRELVNRGRFPGVGKFV